MLAGCEQTPRPPSPPAKRLGLAGSSVEGAPPSPSRPAADFLLESLLLVGDRLAAPLAGTATGREVRWRGDGVGLTPNADGATLTLPSPAWNVTAELVHGDRVLGTRELHAPSQAPIAASTLLGARLAWFNGTPRPSVFAGDKELACVPDETGPERSSCEVAAPPGTLIRFGEGVITAGAGLRTTGDELAERPGECGDPRFPTALAGGVLGCSTPGRLDRHRRRPNGPRRAVSWNNRVVEPSRAGVVVSGGGIAIAQGRSLGTWSPSRSHSSSLRELPLHLPPAADHAHAALVLRDRIQVAPWGSARRVQFPAVPAAGRGLAQVGGGRVAWAQADGVYLASASGGSAGRIGPGRHPVLTPGWLVVGTETAVVGYGLLGQRGWSIPGEAAFSGARGRVGDLLALPSRAGSVLQTRIVHAPTGLAIQTLGDPNKWVVPRGGDADGLVVHERAPGTEGSLRRYPLPRRILEENGVLGLGPGRRAGGHGGRHDVLAPGDSAEAILQTASSARLSAWRPDAGPHDGVITLSVGEQVKKISPDGVGWVDLIQLPRDTAVTVRFVADEGGEGLAMDALLLETGS